VSKWGLFFVSFFSVSYCGNKIEISRNLELVSDLSNKLLWSLCYITGL